MGTSELAFAGLETRHLLEAIAFTLLRRLTAWCQLAMPTRALLFVELAQLLLPLLANSGLRLQRLAWAAARNILKLGFRCSPKRPLLHFDFVCHHA
jgi:hypothetical protein